MVVFWLDAGWLESGGDFSVDRGVGLGCGWVGLAGGVGVDSIAKFCLYGFL